MRIMHTLHTLHSVVAVFDVCVRLRNIALHCTRPAQVDTNSEALERTSAASKDNTDAVKDLGEDIETVQEQLRKVAKDVYVSGCRASANTQRAMRNARCTCNHSKCNTHTHTRTRTHTHTHARAACKPEPCWMYTCVHEACDACLSVGRRAGPLSVRCSPRCNMHCRL